MPKNDKTYRQLMDELDTVMQALQADNLDVDAAITQYENGLRLTKEIADYLTKSENKLTQLRNKAVE